MPKRDLTPPERGLLRKLQTVGIIWLKDAEADIAKGMADTPFIALGPTEPNGNVAALITDAGRTVLAYEES